MKTMKRIIGTYIDNIEVNKVGDKIELLNIEYRKSFLTDLVNYHNNYGVPYNFNIFSDEKGFKIPMNHEGKTSLEAKEYFNKLQETMGSDYKLNYYEIFPININDMKIKLEKIIRKIDNL